VDEVEFILQLRLPSKIAAHSYPGVDRDRVQRTPSCLDGAI